LVAVGCLLALAGCGRGEPGLQSLKSRAAEEPTAFTAALPGHPTNSLEAKSLTLYAQKSFYRERPETEQEWTGILRASPVRTGPNTREFPFRFELPGETLPVYGTGPEEDLLRSLVGHRLRVVGKRVDLRAEGAGFELWIATLAPGDP
jgi:hypothetical protein